MPDGRQVSSASSKTGVSPVLKVIIHDVVSNMNIYNTSSKYVFKIRLQNTSSKCVFKMRFQNAFSNIHHHPVVDEGVTQLLLPVIELNHIDNLLCVFRDRIVFPYMRAEVTGVFTLCIFFPCTFAKVAAE